MPFTALGSARQLGKTAPPVSYCNETERTTNEVRKQHKRGDLKGWCMVHKLPSWDNQSPAAIAQKKDTELKAKIIKQSLSPKASV